MLCTLACVAGTGVHHASTVNIRHSANAAVFAVDRPQDYDEEFDNTAQVHMIVELCPVLQEVVHGETVGWVNVPDRYMVHIGYSQEGFLES